MFSAQSPSIGLIAAINHVFDQADWARDRLQPFAGRSVRVAMFPLSFTFSIGSDGRLLASSASPDLEIVLPAEAPFLALQGNERVMKSADIKGPADLADALGYVLRNLRWDIEEDLSRVVGDIAAHRIVAVLNAFANWQRQAARNLGENVSEYLIDEKKALVKQSEAAAFVGEVEQLRNQSAQLEARVERLTQRF